MFLPLLCFMYLIQLMVVNNKNMFNQSILLLLLLLRLLLLLLLLGDCTYTVHILQPRLQIHCYTATEKTTASVPLAAWAGYLATLQSVCCSVSPVWGTH